MIVLLFFLISYLLTCFTLQKLFEKAGVEAKKAWIPGTNFAEWCKIVGRKPSHAWWMLFPIVNLFIWAGLCVDMVRSYGKHSFGWAAISVIFAPYAFWKLGKEKKAKYVGPVLEMEKKYFADVQAAKEKNDQYKLKKLLAKNPYKKGDIREWAEAIIFAVFAAAFIRMFLIEAYVIPTPSMEGSLLVGDYMFVSKAHYGIRTPMTIAMVPLLHNTIPMIGSESYLKKPSLGYYRLPAIQSIKNNYPIVFNYPEGDSIYITPGRIYSVHDFRKPQYKSNIERSGAKMRTRPIDKRDHYIKRCVAIPGDKFEIRDRQVFINDKELPNSKNIQFQYYVKIPATPDFNLNQFTASLEKIGVTEHPAVKDVFIFKNSPGNFALHLSEAQKAKIKSWYPEATFEFIENKPNEENWANSSVFPHDKKHFGNWTVDNYGPVVIPKEGETVNLTPQNIALYRRIINVYEDNNYSEKNGQFFIDGNPITQYTFKQNYYWGMGDNRHASEDCRYFGFIPEDHIVGKPLFIWFSTKNGNMKSGINWGRLFSGATKM